MLTPFTFAAAFVVGLVVTPIVRTLAHRLPLPWGIVDLGILALPITVAWFVGVINAVNLIDGLDGLASGVVLTVLGAFGLLAAADGIDPTLPIIAATVGAAVGVLGY